jgi:hypothetical protein
MYKSTYSLFLHQLEMSGQLHALVSLTLGKEPPPPPLPTGQDAMVGPRGF